MQEKKGETEQEMVGWHHRLNGHEYEQTPGDSEDSKAWHAVVHGVTKSQRWISDIKSNPLGLYSGSEK